MVVLLQNRVTWFTIDVFGKLPNVGSPSPMSKWRSSGISNWSMILQAESRLESNRSIGDPRDIIGCHSSVLSWSSCSGLVASGIWSHTVVTRATFFNVTWPPNSCSRCSCKSFRRVLRSLLPEMECSNRMPVDVIFRLYLQKSDVRWLRWAIYIYTSNYVCFSHVATCRTILLSFPIVLSKPGVSTNTTRRSGIVGWK